MPLQRFATLLGTTGLGVLRIILKFQKRNHWTSGKGWVWFEAKELVVCMCPGFLQDLAGINNLEVKSKYSLNETSFPWFCAQNLLYLSHFGQILVEFDCLCSNEPSLKSAEISIYHVNDNWWFGLVFFLYPSDRINWFGLDLNPFLGWNFGSEVPPSLDVEEPSIFVSLLGQRGVASLVKHLHVRIQSGWGKAENSEHARRFLVLIGLQWLNGKIV